MEHPGASDEPEVVDELARLLDGLGANAGAPAYDVLGANLRHERFLLSER